MRGLSLFSGNGGIDLALGDYVETIGYCEQDRYSQHLLASRMAEGLLPCAPIYPDVSKLKGEQGYCDIIFGGFPCQDISGANQNGTGLEGERSGLFFEIIRLTKEISPSFVFLENVPAIRTRGLQTVIKEFSNIGYDCRWTVVSAKEVGAHHVRKRWFLLAHSSPERLEEIGVEQGRSEQKKPMSFSEDENVAHSNSKQVWKPERTGWETKAKLVDSDEWQAEPPVDRVVDGTPFRVDRIKSLGNGVVPLQVKTAFERLVGISNKND